MQLLKQKTLGLSLLMTLCDMLAPVKVDGCGNITPLRSAPERQKWRDILSGNRTSGGASELGDPEAKIHLDLWAGSKTWFHGRKWEVQMGYW